MGKIETRKRDCRRSVGIKYKIKPLKKMAHSRDKRTGMNRQQNVCSVPVRLYPFFAMVLFCDGGERFVW